MRCIWSGSGLGRSYWSCLLMVVTASRQAGVFYLLTENPVDSLPSKQQVLNFPIDTLLLPNLCLKELPSRTGGFSSGRKVRNNSSVKGTMNLWSDGSPALWENLLLFILLLCNLVFPSQLNKTPLCIYITFSSSVGRGTPGLIPFPGFCEERNNEHGCS